VYYKIKKGQKNVLTNVLTKKMKNPANTGV
jgi:hypothetical protein